MYSDAGDTTSLVPGFPIRTSSDQRSVDSSPRLIAASYVLHRLLVPRHPPCALKHLQHKIPKMQIGKNCTSALKNPPPSQELILSLLDARNHYPRTNTTPHHQSGAEQTPARPSNQTVLTVSPKGRRTLACSLKDPIVCSVDFTPQQRTLFVVHQNLNATTGQAHPTNRPSRIPHDVGGHGLVVLLRKEVIQPHLPVRLPCYDFVPIADPTFDRSLPKG